MPVTYETVRGWGIGGLIAIVVLIVCIILIIIGKPLEPVMVLGMLAALALSRLL